MSLQDLEAGGGTSLTNAMMNAINQLKFSSCVRLAVLLYITSLRTTGHSVNGLYIHVSH